MQTRPLPIPSLLIPNRFKTSRWRGVVVYDHSTTGNTAIRAWCCRPRSAGIRRARDAEVIGDAALAPDVTADVERAGIQVGKRRQVGRLGVPATVGQMAFATAPGIGGEPVERQMISPTRR
jgi:hypothetical protein